jgi:hypothetical protein
MGAGGRSGKNSRIHSRSFPKTLLITIERASKLIADLSSVQYSLREQAQRGLLTHFDECEKQRREALAQSKSAEQRDRINKIIDASFSAMPQPNQLEQLRAIEVLEQIGTRESGDLLRKIAKSEVPPRILRDAAESLKRLEARPH